MTRTELRAFFPPPGQIAALGANSYAVPTLSWLQNEFWFYFRQRYWDEDTAKWRYRWQCRDFARAYACLAQECWANTHGDGNESDGIAVGEIWFIPDPTKAVGHAVCPAITDKGRVYIEPQNNTLWEMSEEQFRSRYFLRF